MSASVLEDMARLANDLAYNQFSSDRAAIIFVGLTILELAETLEEKGMKP